MNGELSHVDESGSPRMVDVSRKEQSLRTATVGARLELQPAHVEALARLPKGDAITVAQVAGIQAAKRCWELIPLCHPIPLTHVEVQIVPEGSTLEIVATTTTTAPTGVEMEAYTAAVIAGITLIDMLKGVDPQLTLTDVRLLRKAGGKSDYVAPDTS